MDRQNTSISIVFSLSLIQLFLPSCSPYSQSAIDSAAPISTVSSDYSAIDVALFYPEEELGSQQARENAVEQARMMSDAGRIGPGSKVLEIGTGSGYEAAYFHSLGAKVYSVEIAPEAAEIAGDRLRKLSIADVEIMLGDGWQGWPEKGPFDSIIVRASSPSVPKNLLAQLANRGRLVVPIENESTKGKAILVAERNNNDFITHFRKAKVSSKLSGEVRTIPQVKIENAYGFSLIQRMLEGDSAE